MKRNLLILLSGGAAAQLITFASLPILSRLYEPESFGHLAGAMSIASICGAILHGRYHMAIPIPQKPDDPKLLLWLAIVFTAVLSFPTVFIALLIAGHNWPESNFIVYFAACLLLTVGAVLFDISIYWFSYRDRFGLIASTQGARTFITSAVQIATAQISQFGLLIGALSGVWTTLVISLVCFRASRSNRSFEPSLSMKALAEVALRYRHFPLYGTPQGFVASASWNLLPLAILRFDGPSTAGLYWAAYRILIAPLALFNSSYRQVALGLLAKADTERALEMLRRHTLMLVLLGVGSSAILFVIAEEFFVKFLGPSWAGAGQIAAALSLGIAADLFKVPSVCYCQSLHRQRQLLGWEVSVFVARYVPAVLVIWSGNTIHGIIWFSAIGLLGWSVFAVWTLFFAATNKGKP